MNILITNDDGIDSPFLRPLADAFAEIGSVTLAAPACEQSWIGKGMSRLKTVELEERGDFGYPAYALNGTPGDCVNIALGHLVETKPDLIVSGINVGHNTGLAFVLASGTVAGATEGALHSIPSVAVSMGLPAHAYDRLKANPEELDETMGEHVAEAALITRRFVSETLDLQADAYGIVHNLNFPHNFDADTPIERVPVAQTMTRCLFGREGDSFSFRYNEVIDRQPDSPSDRSAIMGGRISYTRLDFNGISA